MTVKLSSTGFRGAGRNGMAMVLASVLVIAAASGITHARNAHWHDPISLCEDTVEKSPLKARAWYNLANAYEQRGNFEQAKRGYEAAIRLQPDYVLAHNNLGNIYLNRGQFEDAIRELQTVLRIKPDTPLAHDNLGYLYFQQGRLDEAIREYQAALKLSPQRAEIHNNLGYAYYANGRLQEAAQEYLTALKLKPDFPAALANLDLLPDELKRQSRKDEQ